MGEWCSALHWRYAQGYIRGAASSETWWPSNYLAFLSEAIVDVYASSHWSGESNFEGFEIVQTYRDHYRALPVARRGPKAWLYKYGFRPVYNMFPKSVAKRFAYKYSVVAVKT